MTSDTGPARVLVVDDNELQRRVAAALVQACGAGGVPAEDGARALERLAAEPFDLVLLDVVMPGLGGLAVAREIRRREAAAGLPPIPIVAMTASVLPEDQALALAAGMDESLAKPLLADEVRALLGRRVGPGVARRTAVIAAPG